MIFKTFDSDTDRFISKIGILGQSFEQIGEKIRQRKLEITDLMGAMSKSDAQKEVGGFWSNIFGSNGQKEKSYDLSTFIDLDEASAGNTLKKLQEFESKVNSGSTTWQEYFSNLKDGQKWQTQFVQNNDLQKASIDDVIDANKVARDSAIQHNAALKAQTLGAKAAAIGMKTLAIAGNFVAFAVISKGIQLAVSAIDNYVHRVEKAKEALSTSVSNLDTTTNDVKELEKQLDEINQKISDINSLGGAQVSKDGELEKLQAQHDQLEANLALMREREYYAAKEVADNASDSYNTTVTSQYKSEWVDRGNNSREKFIDVSPTEELELSINAYKEYSGQLNKINDDIVKKEQEITKARADKKTTKTLEKKLATLTNKKAKIESEIDSARKRSMDMAEIVNSVIEADKKITNLGQSLNDTQSSEFSEAQHSYQKYQEFYDGFLTTIDNVIQGLSSNSTNNKPLFNLEDEDTAKAIDNFQKKFADLSSAIDKVKNSKLSGSELLDLQQAFPELINTTDDLDEALNKLVDETLTQVVDYLKLAGASDGLIETFRNLANEAKGLKSSNDSVMDLTQHIQESYDLLTKIQKEVDTTKQISLDSLSAISKQFPELTTATAEYAQGLISTADLMALLEQAYNNDANAFRTAMSAKLDGNEVFFNTIKQNNEGLFTALANAYGVDVGNWKSMAQAKAEIDSALIQKLGAAWGQYYGVVIDQATGLASLINKTPTTGLTAEQSVDLIVARTNAQSMVSSFNHAKEAMNKAAQIEVGLPDFGGIGGKSGSGGGSKGSKSKEATEFDWMEQKITILDERVDKLKTNIGTLVGYKNKNSMTHTAIDVLTEKMGVLQQMYDKYMEKANNLGLSQEYIDKIQNGTIEIESIGDENLVKVIKEYQDLYNKAQDTSDKISETQQSIHDLNLSKLDNIINQFKQMTDIQSQMIDTEKQLLDLREKSGEDIYADDYISLAGKQLKLTRLNADAYNELAAEMSRLNLQEGTEEWKKYNDQLQEYKNNMISAADAIEQYKDTMTDLVYKGLKDFTSAMDSINGTISTMNSLIGDTNLIDEFGNLTDRGLAQIALYAHQMTNAKQEAAEYAEAIKSLDDALDSGLITQDEYNSMLQEYTSSQESAVKSSKEARDAILALVKEGIQAEIDAKKKLVDETKAALDAEKDLHDYQKSITEKQDNISKLERQIAALSNSTNRNDIAQRLQLQSQLAEAKEELYELQYDHEIEQRKEALDDEYSSFEESKQKESDELDSNLDAQNAAINKYLEQVKSNYSTVYGVLTQYGDEYSLAAIEDLTKPWESGSEAADLCASAIGDVVANIQYEIDGLDFSSLYELVDLLNQIGMNGYGGDLSSYEDISGTGSWQKGQGGKWWYGSSNDDYASGDIYTINGKQYGFDDDGYMITGWNDNFGDWRYFEPENGEMVKSQWRKASDGQWYYLDKDGVMARDMAVKAREGDGYYYLDDEGKWDEKTLSAEQVKKLGYTIGYKKGRKRIPHDQLAWTQEDRPEIITRPSDGALLTPLKLGDGVINGDLTQNLLDIAGNPNGFIEDIIARSMPNYKIPEFNIVRNQPVEINSPLVQIDGTGLSASEVTSIIKNETRDIDKRVAKSIRYELRGK